MMRFLKRFPLVHIQAKLFSPVNPSRLHCHTHPRPNEKLKEYLKANSTTKVLLLFRDMLRGSIGSIDSFSLLFVIKTCTQNPSASKGKQIHALVIKLGYESVIYLQAPLISMYSAKANLDNAHRVFEEIPNKNVVCWTALISAYVDNRKPNRALQLFREMQMSNVEPDQVTVTVALSACADLGALDTGEWIHNYIRRKEFDADLSLCNALLNMYVKCGDIKTAKVLFCDMETKDVTTWTSMIVGYALNGQAEDALSLFARMKEEKRSMRYRTGRLIVPNDVTFVGVLMACSHAGLVEEGKRYFRSMTEDYKLQPRATHYGCMVDLLCRGGLLQEAYELIMTMPIVPNAVQWRTLLSACSLNGNIRLAAEARGRLLKLEENLVNDDIMMSNIYAASGLWDRKASIRDGMKQRRAPGCSSIEVGSSDISEFVTGDDHHPFRREIYNVLGHLMENMREPHSLHCKDLKFDTLMEDLSQLWRGNGWAFDDGGTSKKEDLEIPKRNVF